LILFYGRKSREYRLVIGDCVICLGPKIEFNRECAIAVALALTAAALGQDTIPISRTNRSILQPEEEAQIQRPGFTAADYMTGDWGGLRERLFAAGVEVFAFDNSIYNGNVSGGIHPGHSTIVNDAFAGLKFDLEKLVDWQGGLFVISGIDRAGEDLTKKYVGSIYSVQQMVGGQRPFLYQVYLQQKFPDIKVTLKLGRFSASDDFNASPFYGYSLNNGIDGDIRNVLFDTRFSAYPFPVWAAALFYDPTPEFIVKLGLFRTSKDMFDNTEHGLDWSIRGEDGYTAIAQFGWLPQFFKQPVTSDASDGKGSATPVLKGMPGHTTSGLLFRNGISIRGSVADSKIIPTASMCTPTKWSIRRRRAAIRDSTCLSPPDIIRRRRSRSCLSRQTSASITRACFPVAMTTGRSCILSTAISVMITRAVFTCPAATSRIPRRCWNSGIDFR
jgi:Carbohydrate-selective porin, OprB family